jgi:hypothetical protein
MDDLTYWTEKLRQAEQELDARTYAHGGQRGGQQVPACQGRGEGAGADGQDAEAPNWPWFALGGGAAS